MICCSHPGKIGDCLYTLPTVRELCRINNCKADFYTSECCRPIVNFLKQQECINDVIIPNNYIIEGYGCGTQPWNMPIPADEYSMIYQLGFKKVPDKSLPEFIAESAGLDRSIGKNLYYDIIDDNEKYEEYYVIAPRGRTSFHDCIVDISKELFNLDKRVYIIGGNGEFQEEYKPFAIDKTGESYLKMIDTIAHCKAFIGILSSPLVVANGFSMKKYIPYNTAWDMNHSVYKNETKYSINPSAKECLEWILN